MGSLYLWGCSSQEMGGNVVIGRPIYGVVVIDGYSDSTNGLVDIIWFSFFISTICEHNAYHLAS